MRTINAEENNDGTWHVIIKADKTLESAVNGIPIKEDYTAITDIPRADIKIIAYKNIDEEETIFKFKLEA